MAPFRIPEHLQPDQLRQHQTQPRLVRNVQLHRHSILPGPRKHPRNKVDHAERTREQNSTSNLVVLASSRFSLDPSGPDPRIILPYYLERLRRLSLESGPAVGSQAESSVVYR